MTWQGPTLLGPGLCLQRLWLRTAAQICNGSGEDPQCHDGACYLGLCTSVDDHLVYLGVYMGQGEEC